MKMESVTYIVSLFIVLLGITLAISYTNHSESLEAFHQVKIEKGDSLWSIAEEFKEKTHISKQDFVKWVQDKNGIHSNMIKPGDTVFVPVEKEEVYLIDQVASE